jgi:hypothetical protein
LRTDAESLCRVRRRNLRSTSTRFPLPGARSLLKLRCHLLIGGEGSGHAADETPDLLGDGALACFEERISGGVPAGDHLAASIEELLLPRVGLETALLKLPGDALSALAQMSRVAAEGGTMDAVALISLADLRLDADPGSLSILDLFGHERPPQGLTLWDRALLYSLYNTEQASRLGVSQMEMTMVRHIAP